MAAASGLLVALAGIFSVLVVQARANFELTRSNAALAAANERERARFNLALEAIKTFHGGVSEDLLLKEKQFDGLRTKCSAARSASTSGWSHCSRFSPIGIPARRSGRRTRRSAS
jgi:hypothetical protein